ncbi:uncharacterized protein [Dermacentor albipictus]|uniref:uncharacterized protein isoform X1 n=2 Tax=Dermacentor albipictus TaxID=60249 RepID=UPI0031FD5AD1
MTHTRRSGGIDNAGNRPIQNYCAAAHRVRIPFSSTECIGRKSATSAASLTSGTMGLYYCWLLVLTAAATALAVTPLSAMVNEQVDCVLQSGDLCKFENEDSSCDDLAGSINMWSGAASSCRSQFYEGYITNLDQGIRRTGDCASDPHDPNVVTCELSFVDVELHYRWLLLRANPKVEGDEYSAQSDAHIEAGNLKVTLTEGSGLLLLEEDVAYGDFQATSFEADTIEIRELVFDNPTVTCNGEVIDTNEEAFQVQLRKALLLRMDEYISGGRFVDAFNEALEEEYK